MSMNTLAPANQLEANIVVHNDPHDDAIDIFDSPMPMRTTTNFFRSDTTGHDGQRTEDRKSRMKETLLSKRFSIQLSTEQHNRTDEESFFGPYQHLKKEMDYNYHSYYKIERQWLHDSIIEDYLCHEKQSESCVAAEPWLIYTCGVKGAGKRYLINKLMEDGRLPLLSTIIVDADEIRRFLPEFSSYVDSTPDLVSKRMNKEAGYIAELLTLASLQAGDNVILDGRLKDTKWHMRQFRKLRKLYPKLRIALFHVTAPLDVIMDRIEDRSKETGIHIPKEEIQSVLDEIPASVEAVKAQVDYFCTLHNSGDFELEGDNWSNFTANFTQEVEIVNETCKKRNFVGSTGTLPPFGGIPKPQILKRRRASVQETTHAANSFRLRRRSLRKPFRVNISTEENHKADDMVFHGKYSHIRETLDYSYHSNYTYDRQKLQDSIISKFLNAAVITDKDGQLCTTPTEPWLVFTAGAMGAGKSYTMRKLVENGRFPLISFVSVDPDQIRRYLPEYHLYLDSNPELAGELTHKEAGYIQEILTLAALQAGKNVMVDGSLRNAEWYATYFERLRTDFRMLRIAIIHVTAPREAIFHRAASRAIFTGRVVPIDVLQAAIEQVPKSMKTLAPLVDYYVELRNDPETPEIELVTEGETWENFESKWIQSCAWVPSNKEKLLRKSNNPPESLE